MTDYKEQRLRVWNRGARGYLFELKYILRCESKANRNKYYFLKRGIIYMCVSNNYNKNISIMPNLQTKLPFKLLFRRVD